MPDIFTKQKRSEIMSKIRSKGTKIELKMKAELDKLGLLYEYQPKIYGKPDFLILPNVVVFCDSAFWHGRNWSKLKPQLSEGYWREHIEENRRRDRVVNRKLKKDGYIVLRFWDSDIERRIGKCRNKILSVLKRSP